MVASIHYFIVVIFLFCGSFTAFAENLKIEKYGVEFSYPKDWILRDSPGNCIIKSIEFSTERKYKASFILTYMGPMRKTFKQYRSKVEKKKLVDIKVGNEIGFEVGTYECDLEGEERKESCFVSFEYNSPTLFNRGLNFNMSFDPGADAKNKNINPKQLLTENDLLKITNLLNSFKFMPLEKIESPNSNCSH